MKKIFVVSFIVSVTIFFWVFYYYKFFSGFSDEVYRDFTVAQNFLEKKKFLTQELSLPEVVIYEKLGFLFHKDWPNLSRGPFLGICLALVSYFFGISLEYSFLFLILVLFISLAVLSYKFFQKFLPFSLAILGSLFLISNFFLLETLFRNPVLVINLFVFSLVFYLVVGEMNFRRLVLSVLILGINYYNSSLTLLFFFLIFLYLYWRERVRRREQLLIFSTVFLLVITPFLYFRYRFTLNPFFSSKSASMFLSFTQSFPEEEIRHYLRGVNIKDFFKAHPREVLVKSFAQLHQGINEFTATTSNFLLFVLGLCGFFYNFKKFSPSKYSRLKKIESLKLFLGFTLSSYFLLLSPWKIEASSLLVFLFFVILFGLAFIFCETKRRRGVFKKVYLLLFLIVLVVLNLYPFLFREREKISEEEFNLTLPLLDGDVVHIGPPSLAYQTGRRVVALPLQLEDLEEYHLRVYSIYLKRELVDQSKGLRYKGWGKVFQEKRLAGFELVREFKNGDLFFVAQQPL